MFYLVTSVVLYSFVVTLVSGRGLSVIGGKGKGTVCADCEAKEFDPTELTWALIMLTSVTCCYLAVCFCRCYPKLKTLWNEGPIPYANNRNANRAQTPIPKDSNIPIDAQMKSFPGSVARAADCALKAVPGYPNRRRSSFGSNRFHNRRLSNHRIEISTQSPKKERTPSQTPKHKTQTPKHQTLTPRSSLTTQKRVDNNNEQQKSGMRRQDNGNQDGRRDSQMKEIVFDYPIDRNGRLIPYPGGAKPEIFSITIPIESDAMLSDANKITKLASKVASVDPNIKSGLSLSQSCNPNSVP